MDIELAATGLMQMLTLDEKTQGRALLYSQRIYSSPGGVGTVWLRAPKFALSDAVKTARDMASERKILISFLEIFCDTLVVQPGESTSGWSLNNKSDATRYFDGTFTLQIYARKIISSVPGQQPTLKVETVRGTTVIFWMPGGPSDFEVSFAPASGTETKIKPTVEPDNFGVAYTSGDGIEIEQLPAPRDALENINYLELINEDGTVKEQGYLNDELPRLLQMQMLVAQANHQTDRQFAIDLLNYVILASASSISIQLNYQAVALRNSLALGRDLTAASSINVYASKQVLKARLSAAMAFEQAYRDFSLQTGNAKLQTVSSLNMLAKSNDALETYKFIINIRQREYDNARDANDKAKVNFDKNNGEIKTKGEDFEAGITKFKKAQEAEATKSIIKGIISIGVAIAATVATAGAASPGIVAAGAGVVGSVSKTASLIQKIKAIYDKLKEIKEKIKPILEKLGEIVETSKKLIEMLEALKKGKQTVDDAVALKPGKQSGEVSEIGLAEWQRFNIAVLDMQDQLRDYDIEGKREYFMSLKTLVVSGECYIKTQVNLVQKCDDLAIIQLQGKMESKDQNRIAAMSYLVATNEKVLTLLKRAMFDRVLMIRTFVYQDFHTYSLAYNYHTLSKDSILRLSPVKPVVDYLEDAAILQGAVVAYGSRVLIQSRKFTFRSLCGYDNGADLGSTLLKTGSIKFNVDPQDALWKGFSRIRMSSARCYLDGAKTASQSAASESIKLLLETDGRFFDRDCFQKDADKVIVPVRSFVGDPRSLLFEYNLNNKAIVCDGLWGQERDYTKYTPMASWNLSIVGHQGPETVAETLNLDLSGLTGIVMEFACDVVWTGW